MKATISGVKQRARLLKTNLEGSGIDITLSRALEAISASENGTDWNRYSAALKAARITASDGPYTSEYPPHKIFAAGPGSGSSTIAECVYAYNIIAGRVPVIIMLHDYCFPQNKLVDTQGWVNIEVQRLSESRTNVRDLKDDDEIKGIIIRPRFDRQPPDGLEPYATESGKEISRLELLKVILRDSESWPPSLKKKIGTIILYGMELVDFSMTSTYSDLLPNYMKAMRERGGQQELFIVTSSDIMKNDILVSKDEYKLIISEFSPGKLFPRCPVDKLLIEHGQELLYKRWRSLFCKKSKVIEDICLYVGSLVRGANKKEVESGNETFSWVQLYLEQLLNVQIVHRLKEEDECLWKMKALEMYRIVLNGLSYYNKDTIKIKQIEAHATLDEIRVLANDLNLDYILRRQAGIYLSLQPIFEVEERKNGFTGNTGIPDFHRLLCMYLSDLLPQLSREFNIEK